MVLLPLARRLTALLVVLASLASAPPARAAEPDEGEDLPTFFAEPTGSFWVGIGASLRRTDERTEVLGLAMLGLPLERWARPTAVYADPPKPAPAPAPPPPVAEAARPIPVVVRADLARKALDAALAHARLPASSARLDGLATRARAAALLPELRVRVSQQLDESQAESPTQYDPARTTSSGATTLWLEGRATWRLDRLVFVDDELALERLRNERATAARRLEEQVLAELLAWQRARALEADDTRSPEEHRDDVLAVLSHELTLELLTGGFFLAYLRENESALAAP